MKRILFCGEGHGGIAVLRGMLNANFRPDIFSKDAKIRELASCHNLNTNVNIDSWSNSKEDVIVSGAYRDYLNSGILNKATVTNVHYALLPRYRGLHSTVWSILNGEKYVGWTYHEMDERLDGGPIIFQEKLEVGNKTSWDLMLEMDKLVENSFGNILTKYLSKQLTARKQNDEDAIFVGKRNLEDCQIDWEKWGADYFEKVLKALVEPYPLPFFIYKNQKYEVTCCKVVRRFYIEIPGHVVYRDNDSVWVKLKDGLLQIFSLRQNSEIISPLKVFGKTGARLKWKHMA